MAPMIIQLTFAWNTRHTEWHRVAEGARFSTSVQLKPVGVDIVGKRREREDSPLPQVKFCGRLVLGLRVTRNGRPKGSARPIVCSLLRVRARAGRSHQSKATPRVAGSGWAFLFENRPGQLPLSACPTMGTGDDLAPQSPYLPPESLVEMTTSLTVNLHGHRLPAVPSHRPHMSPAPKTW